jgi:N-acetylglucosamine kinase-like BadF-type ATPase
VGGSLYLGADAGNSKTQALVAQRDGTVVGASHVAGCADIYQAASPDEALDVVMRAADEALAASGGTRDSIASAAFGMAGADWPEDIEFLEAQLRSRGIGGSVMVVNDAIGALWGGLPAGPGVAVACGTGAATGARGPLGEWHSSFWQGPQGANDLAQQSLHAAYRSELGIEPPTSLVLRLPEALGMPDLESVLHARTGRGTARPVIDRLAAVVLDEASRGDAVALRIVREHGRELGDYALAAARKVGMDLAEPFGLVLTGGVFRHEGRELRDAVVERVRNSAPKVEVASKCHSPVVGALRLAFREAGLDSPDVEARLQETVPADVSVALAERAQNRRHQRGSDGPGKPRIGRSRRPVESREAPVAERGKRRGAQTAEVAEAAASGLTPAQERQVAVDLFNHVWSLLDVPERTRADDDRMLHAAHASRFHWGEVGEPVNLVRGEWQVSRVYSVLRRPEPALFHARRCLELCEQHGIGDFDLAYAYEALARASLVAGQRGAVDQYIDLARDASQRIAEQDDRDLFLKDLDELSGLS